jgi:pectinesterase
MVGLGVELSNAQVHKTYGNKLLPYKTIIVDSKGHGNFSTIQSAINSIPSNNKNWTSINITAGLYR